MNWIDTIWTFLPVGNIALTIFLIREALSTRAKLKTVQADLLRISSEITYEKWAQGEELTPFEAARLDKVMNRP